MGPSRQRAEFQSDGSDEALRKTNWNKSLIKNILVPMMRDTSIELTDLVPDLIRQNPQYKKLAVSLYILMAIAIINAVVASPITIAVSTNACGKGSTMFLTPVSGE